MNIAAFLSRLSFIRFCGIDQVNLLRGMQQPVKGISINSIILLLNRQSEGPSQIEGNHGVHIRGWWKVAFVHVTDDDPAKIEVPSFQNSHNLQTFQRLSIKWQLYFSEHLFKEADVKIQTNRDERLLLKQLVQPCQLFITLI